MTDPYRELTTLAGYPRLGDVIVLRFAHGGAAKADFRASDGGLLFQARVFADGRVRIARQDGETWTTLAEGCADGDGELRAFVAEGSSLEIRAPFFDGPVGVPLRAPVDHIWGDGDGWIFVELTPAGFDPNLAAAPLTSLSQAKQVDGDRPLAFDLGFYDGADTAYYLWLGMNVVAVEANPALAERGAKRFQRDIAEGRLQLLNLAIAEHAGEVEFYVNEVRAGRSSTDPDFARRGLPVRATRVQAITPSDLFGAFPKPDYLKIDIENADILVLKALADLPAPPEFLSFEVADRTTPDIIRALADLGYDRFNIVDQSDVRNTVDRQGGADFAFKKGASGRFGARSPGPWIDADLAARWLAGHLPGMIAEHERRRRTGEIRYGSWYDIHAALKRETL